METVRRWVSLPILIPLLIIWFLFWPVGWLVENSGRKWKEFGTLIGSLITHICEWTDKNG